MGEGCVLQNLNSYFHEPRQNETSLYKKRWTFQMFLNLLSAENQRQYLFFFTKYKLNKLLQVSHWDISFHPKHISSFFKNYPQILVIPSC